MRKVITLLLGISLSFVLHGCGKSPSFVPTPPGESFLSTPTLTPIPIGKTIVVTSAADRGIGTLRQALLDAQSGDTITFDPKVFPPDNAKTIYVSREGEYNALPLLNKGGITIDASDAGVILDGNTIKYDWIDALAIYSDGNIIQGLQVINFSGAGIAILDGSDNKIGGNRNIGFGPLGQGNLTSKNYFGMYLGGSGSNNTITGNIIGTDPNMIEDWGNKRDGIWIDAGTTKNTIGPNNTIAFNAHFGIRISGLNTFENTITQNSFYHSLEGIRLWANSNNMIKPPLISSVDLTRGTVTGTACSNCIIEFFSTQENEGQIYEGETKTDFEGVFSFNKGSSFAGPYLNATATDFEGNTSEFPVYTRYAWIQDENGNPAFRLHTLHSDKLEDNNIGIHFVGLWKLEPEVFPDNTLNVNHILYQGVTRARFSINWLEAREEKIFWDKPEMMIDPIHDDFISSLAENGIAITYVLNFYDKDYVAKGGEISYPRFRYRTEDEMQRYLDFVRFIVNHFKDRVSYFEIWNEPNLDENGFEDYINLIKRAVPVIKQEYPDAKIVIGGFEDLIEHHNYEMFINLLQCDDIMPLVDAISWHGMYGISPEHDSTRDFYYDYPSMVMEIKETALAHGFEGEYISDELVWGTQDAPTHNGLYQSEIKSAKYYARAIIMNLGLDVIVSQFYGVPNEHPMQIVRTIQNLTTIMSGEKPTDLPVEILSNATNLTNYSFELPNGDNLLAVWNDGVALDFDPGISSTVIISGFAGWNAKGVDTVYGFEQELITSDVNGDLVIHDFLLKDYPIIIWLSK